MKKDIEQYTVQFHNRAREVFFSLYSDFKHSIAGIDRQGDENVFQQLWAKYTHEVRAQLQTIAAELLGELSTGSRNEFNHILHTAIEDYVQEFVQKVRSL
jgi:hypothetical protein